MALKLPELNVRPGQPRQVAPGPDQPAKIEKVSKKDIAIIGISVNMPDAQTPEHFWSNIKNGVDSIGDFPENRKRDMEDYLYYLGIPKSQVEWAEAAYLKDIDKFDYKYFGLTQKEAGYIDPNQRLFLETAWSAVEDAGYGNRKLAGTKTGVYLGYAAASVFWYGRMVMEIDTSDVATAFTGNLSAVIASRISYMLNLNGPSMIVDTACSSSLAAVHLACQGIRNGDCEQALVGSIKLNLMPFRYRRNGGFGIESDDGRTRTFDDHSDGTGIGEGVVALLLKPLSKALKDGDHVHGVIKGTAVNQDGSSIWIAAPNAAAQANVIDKAWKDGGIDPSTVSYVEVHGTATPLGDPIEVEGLHKAFRRYTDKKQFCAVGTVKTNIGHIGNASGIAGLVKAILSMKHRQIAPNLHFRKPNRNINFLDSPIYVNDRLREWEADGQPLRCGVTTIGMSGANSHIVLEEAPKRESVKRKSTPGYHVLTLSGLSESVIQKWVGQYADFFDRDEESPIEDICYTANTGRGHFTHRLALVVKDRQDLIDKIRKLCGRHDFSGLESEGIFYGVSEATTSVSQELQVYGQQAQNAVSDRANDLDAYRSLCEAYIQGASITWDSLYREGEYQRVSLPSYPFEGERCWINIPKTFDRRVLNLLANTSVLIKNMKNKLDK